MVKPRRLSNAYLLFDKSPERIPVARNDLGLSEFMSYPEMGIKENGDPMPNEISGCVIKEGNGLDRRLAINLLSACSHEGGLEVGQIYHAFFLKTGLAGDQFVGTSLVDMYAKCGDIGAAVLAFKQMAHADVASYNCLISGYGGHGMFGKAFDLFLEMGDMGLEPNHYTYAIMLTICGTLSATEEGKQLHAHVVKMQYLSEVVVGNALLTMYNKYGMMEDAESLFDGLAHRNLITWTTIINGFYQHGDFLKALGLLCLMRKDGVEPNEYAFTIALACCGSMKNFYISRMFHALVTKRGMNENDFILTALLNMYSGVGEMDYAKRLLKVRGKLLSVVSWNALISGFVHNQKFEEAMEAFSDMVKNNVTCDKFTYSIMLKACSSMPSLAICKQLHSQVVKLKYESNTHVGSSLIEAYTNCGSPEDSEQAFNQILKPDVVSWNSMIKCYSQNGHPRKAMFFFRKMVQEGIKPTNSTFLGILSACSHSGLVQEGQEFFNKMVARYNILPEETHYSSMVDLLGRAGQLENALDFIKKLPIKPTASIWRPLLAACRSHKNIQIAEFVAKQILDLEPYDATVYITLYNIYSEAGRPLDAEKQRKLMVTKEVVKEPGCSWIEVNNKIYEFFSQDKTHPEMQKLDEKLKQIMRNIKDATGANLLFGPEESQAENEEETVLYHSEG